MTPEQQHRRGLSYGLAAYILWGFLPIYWRALHSVAPIEILANRIMWSMVLVGAIILFRGEFGQLWQAARTPRLLGLSMLSGVLLGLNWYIYIWSVNNDFVLESSLGYFITPLINMLFGVLFVHERLRSGQWAALGVMALGVIYLTVTYGQLPWIALTLATSFGLYGYIKKMTPLPALHSLTLETATVVLPAIGVLLFLQVDGSAALFHSDWYVTLLLIFTGVITATPLLWFAIAARNIPLTLIGVLQYISPSMQFLLGVFLFEEHFTTTRLIGFLIIWTALVIYSVEGMVNRQRLANQRLANGAAAD
jgi:chloramphenicol-sensitive protein RarD